jgi:photosystem II stability/assembly factor-like uncharacterized protein
MKVFRFAASTILVLVSVAAYSSLSAQEIDPSLYAGMRWRSIGPFRAGRVSAVAGIPGNAAVYYMASPGGGVWKTVDGGVVWTPIFDAMKVASIGAMVVSPSDPNTIYVGTGDVSMVGSAVNMGDGIYKSADAGQTWTHVGLDETEHIGAMWIDPADPNTVFVAALGKTFSPNPERGVFKTTDGGKTWRKVLAGDDETGAVDITFDATNKKIGYATLWHHYCKPGDNTDLINGASGGAIYKTTDGGDTWTKLTGQGLPTGPLSRIGVATAMGGQRVYAVIAARNDAGFFRSDDGGATWIKSTTDARVTGSGYFSRVFVDPKDPETLYVAQTSLYRSVDGGHTFISFKGAPGGDDNHALWIDPTDSSRMIMASDQGATISMDAGKSWSSWYNQPTAQVYHMSTDNRYPYWVYGTQQDSGSVGTLSRGDYGAITFFDWDPVAAYEFGYIVPSPIDPNMIVAGGPGRGLVLVNRTNRQVQTISPSIGRIGAYRSAQNPPIAFSPQDPHIFYWATQFLLQTSDNGTHWKTISPDLTVRPGSDAVNDKEEQEAKSDSAPARKARTRENGETLTPPNRSAINCFAPSPVAAGQIWAGTTNGLVQLTQDGGATWHIVTPPGLTQYSQISIIEASHVDAGTAYAAVDRHEENDFAPHIYRTHDFGKTWEQLVSGIAPGDFVRVVHQDPKRKDLLYAGTENRAYVSFDEGEHWNPLQMNMPVTSVRDLQINGNDLVAATYGRSFWVLDDVTPLRQIEAKTAHQSVVFFKPSPALRVHLNLNGDTPIPPELPAGQNPPSGALLDYYLKSAPQGDIKLAIYDSGGTLVREFSSLPQPAIKEPPPPVPDYWLAIPQPLTKNVGENRFLWDLHFTPPSAIRHNYPISALYQNTPGEPQGALAAPGTYQAKLTVNGKVYTQPLEVKLDPRVATTQQSLEDQQKLVQQSAVLVTASYNFHHQAVVLREAIAGEEKKLEMQSSDTVKALHDFDVKVVHLQGAEGGRGGGPPVGRPAPTFAAINQQMGSLITTIDSADAAPTPAMEVAYRDGCHDLVAVSTQWNTLMTNDLPALNEQLAAQKISALPGASVTPPTECAAQEQGSVAK